MNIGMVLVGLMLVMASVLGIFAIASQSQQPYTDTFGAVQSNETNATMSTIDNTTASLSGAGGGLALVFAVILVAVTGIVLVRFITKYDASGRR